MKRFDKIALSAMILAGAFTSIVTAPAQAQVSFGIEFGVPAYSGHHYRGASASCNRRSPWFNPRRCARIHRSDDYSYYADPYGGGAYGSQSYNYGGYSGNYGGYGGDYRGGYARGRGEYDRSFGSGRESARGSDGSFSGGRNGGGDVRGDFRSSREAGAGGAQGDAARRAMRGNFSPQNQIAPQQDAAPAQQPVFNGSGQRGGSQMSGQGGGGRGEGNRVENVTAPPDQNRGGNGFRNNGGGAPVAPAASSSGWNGFQGHNPADPNNTD